MKAQEYADKFNAEPDYKKAISEIGTQFVFETRDLILKRGIKSPTAGLAVIKEQSDKWKSFCRRIGGGVKEDGYLIIMRAEFPELVPYL